jgi:mitochondrial fission protein ELM1
MQPLTTDNLSCWAVTAGDAAGMVNQVKGLAQALSPNFEQKTVPQPPALWRLMPGHWAARLRAGHRFLAPDMHAPWPDLMITCGKRSVPAAIAVKRVSGGRTFIVHIQDPRVPAHHFDLITPPEHDGLTGPNVFPSIGALHHITPEALANGAARFRERFASLPRPLVAALIGGKTKTHGLTPARARELAEQLKAVTVNHGAGLIVTTSRRTGPECAAIIRNVLAGSGAMLWDGEGENPYFGMLALADWIVVTADSASMVSEACFTGKPVYIADLRSSSKRIDSMHRTFREAGFTRPFAGELDRWVYTPLDETRRIAAIVHERLKHHRSAFQALSTKIA